MRQRPLSHLTQHRTYTPCSRYQSHCYYSLPAPTPTRFTSRSANCQPKSCRCISRPRCPAGRSGASVTPRAVQSESLRLWEADVWAARGRAPRDSDRRSRRGERPLGKKSLLTSRQAPIPLALQIVLVGDGYLEPRLTARPQLPARRPPRPRPSRPRQLRARQVARLPHRPGLRPHASGQEAGD